ncbi:hypothetical protein SPRG_21851 [Saprolegnia parasitica CBS 223.65]|uniref:Guanylate cyclase domain-containing protein n=1 Tax=Saprolegnia parasitica (strain CBS 223.65) TaxID=695850 RepID=A0A067BLN8_SAPPC|nr:hypothetical protein SPRG_21851 [Saprolegnia parasitica CBS 223.65]KDO17630.1 hypothetical protein SPRG_21851 [Saprolegnia parasitica CBS 223.65]|eukprot:XP_012211664.1 hypothetical protein SPRG_21851 [Saprolegnia parasitica CBS 223.65]
MKNTRKISPELQSTTTHRALHRDNSSNKFNTSRALHRDNSINNFTTMATLRPPPFHRAGSMRTPTQRWGMAILERKSYAGLMSFITLYCLFADDFRAAFFSKSADMGFYVVAFLCLVLFLVEFGISCLCKPGYLLSFYFYLDVLATFSLLPDIGFIWSPLTNADTVSSVSKAGSTAGRIVRVVRVIRLIRVVKLIKWKHSKAESDLVIVESKTGGRMAEMTIRRVALIVLFLCFVLPAFDGGYNESFNLFESRGFDLIHQMTTTPTDVSMSPIFLNTFGSWFYYTTNDIVYLSLHNITGDKFGRLFTSFSFPRTDISTAQMAKVLPSQAAVLDTYRISELRSITSTGCFAAWNGSDIVADPVLTSMSCQSVVWFDISEMARATAISGIYRTIFILGILVVSSISFVHVARVTVLDPIERMMATVKELSENPLGKHTHVEHEDQRLAKEKGVETAVLEATLEKISGLMQVGFGAAGGDIIGKNMGAGDLDPMLPGKKITSIYGFCDIRQFTDTTECLQEEVMVYVNKLGHIMHSGTHHYYGMANKNVGDAFLLSWKICDGELPGFARFSDTPTEEDRKVHHLPATRFETSGSNAKLHLGRAIGSRFKIDATYISPHVEMADRLEAGSKIFKTPVNISHWLYALLSPAARKFLRKMDRIRIRGVDTPLTVYTFDVTNPKPGFATPKFELDKRGKEVQVPVDFENDPEYKEIREGLDPAFLEAASNGVELYLEGDWRGAKVALTQALELRPGDGPVSHVMDYMKSFDFDSPKNWEGVRELDGY